MNNHRNGGDPFDIRENAGFERGPNGPSEEAYEETGEFGNIELLLDIPLTITVELGEARLPLEEVLRLGPGSVLRLNRGEHEGVELRVNGRLIATGQIIQLPEGGIGVEVVSIATRSERLRSLQ
ncbi:MAG: hypothetical protein KatS3mg115_1580 [Candidatus Poribacteria bacterium]|nr:MAG: hypothetical protein KatS3mg115_1580 [Candidatus Poribacteria bacterium]